MSTGEKGSIDRNWSEERENLSQNSSEEDKKKLKENRGNNMTISEVMRGD